MDSFSDLGIVAIMIIIAIVVIIILMVVAVLKIPKLVKYQKASMKINALIAKKLDVDKDVVQQIVNESDEQTLKDYSFSKELSK